MTRAKNPDTADKEARLQEAITTVQNKEHTCHSTTITFNVPRRTLYDRVNENRKACNQAHESDQVLTHVEEKELVRWITLLTITEYPPRYEVLRRLTEILRERRLKENDVPLMIYDEIGQQWIQRFLRHHPELASIRPRSIDVVRIKDTSPERLQ